MQNLLDHLRTVPTILLDHAQATCPLEPTIRITTAVYGVHCHGTAYRMDEVPIPLRPVLTSNAPTDGDVLRAMEGRL